MPMLTAGQVHIWIAGVPLAVDARFRTVLSQQERARADRFRFEKHRSAYIFAHAVLREVLSRYCSASPAEIRFSVDSFGKPSLTGADDTLMFNLSHSGALVVIGICVDRRIGVDVEHIRGLPDFGNIAERHFTAVERSFIFDQPPAEQERAFFRCWTRKEAYIKAVGKGLSIPLDSFDTLIADGESGRALARCIDAPDVAAWRLADLDVPEGYAGAVVVQNGIECLTYFEWNRAEWRGAGTDTPRH
jgi:4'-phosphopantetheinyl transferase